MSLRITCGGAAVQSVKLHIPGVGPWFADVTFADEAASVPQNTPIVLQAGSVELHGVIPTALDGVFGLQRRATLVAGRGAWGALVKDRGYHNDAGVKASKVIQDLAAEIGETLGTITPAADRLGSHWARESGVASMALERASGGAAWYVDFAGVTQIAQRSATTPSTDAYQILQAWPDQNYALVGIDEINTILPGATLTERLPAPVTVRSVEVDITPEHQRALVWFYSAGKRSKLADALKTIAKAAVAGPLWGKYRYRVGQLSGDRVDLQVVRRAAGVPSLLSVPIWPGVAGVSHRLTLGSEVGVEFLDGDRAQPAITSFSPKGSGGFVAVELVLGGTEGSPAAAQGDTVTLVLPPFVFNGTVGGVPATGVMIAQAGQTLGSITTGSPKVKVAK